MLLNLDDEGKVDRGNLGTMKSGYSISILLLSVASWKDLNPVCKITTLAMDMCLWWSVCPLNR